MVETTAKLPNQQQGKDMDETEVDYCAKKHHESNISSSILYGIHLPKPMAVDCVTAHPVTINDVANLLDQYQHNNQLDPILNTTERATLQQLQEEALQDNENPENVPCGPCPTRLGNDSHPN